MSDGSRAGDLRSSILGASARAARGIHWWLTELMGDRAYATYLEHHRRHHPGEEPVSERAFWRARDDDRDRNPGARCC
jgi:uncharacterized short protein YbdD (DUF466 family)